MTCRQDRPQNKENTFKHTWLSAGQSHVSTTHLRLKCTEFQFLPARHTLFCQSTQESVFQSAPGIGVQLCSLKYRRVREFSRTLSRGVPYAVGTLSRGTTVF